MGDSSPKIFSGAPGLGFLSIALSVITADFARLRGTSSDGWTRQFELEVAVADPVFWNGQACAIADALQFLTTDRWTLTFHGGGLLPAAPAQPILPEQDCVVLLSGGLDSLIGAIDLANAGKKPLAISQTVRGDANKQAAFAAKIGGGLRHIQLNHNARVPGVPESVAPGALANFHHVWSARSDYSATLSRG